MAEAASARLCALYHQKISGQQLYFGQGKIEDPLKN